MYRIETVDAWVRIKPLIIDKMNEVAKVTCDDNTLESMCINIENYLINDPENIFIAVWIEDGKIASYTILMKHDNLCCISQLWCRPGYFFHLFDYISTLREFADGSIIYWDSKREPSDKFLKRFNFKKKYIRYELGDKKENV